MKLPICLALVVLVAALGAAEAESTVDVVQKGPILLAQGGDGAWREPQPDPVYLTGGALLVYFLSGYDHRTPNKARQYLARGIDFLLAQQDEDGAIAGDAASQAIAATALVEAYAITADQALRVPAQRAIDALLAQRQALPGLEGRAWGADGTSGRWDLPVTSQAMQALEQARRAGLVIGDGLTEAERAVAAGMAFGAAQGTPHPRMLVLHDDGAVEAAGTAREATLCALVLAGRKAEDPAVTRLRAELLAALPPDGSWQRGARDLYLQSLAFAGLADQQHATWLAATLPVLAAHDAPEWRGAVERVAGGPSGPLTDRLHRTLAAVGLNRPGAPNLPHAVLGEDAF